MVDVYFKEGYHSVQKTSHPPYICVSCAERHILWAMWSYESKYRGDGQIVGIGKLVTIGIIEGM